MRSEIVPRVRFGFSDSEHPGTRNLLSHEVWFLGFPHRFLDFSDSERMASGLVPRVLPCGPRRPAPSSSRAPLRTEAMASTSSTPVFKYKRYEQGRLGQLRKAATSILTSCLHGRPSRPHPDVVCSEAVGFPPPEESRCPGGNSWLHEAYRRNPAR